MKLRLTALHNLELESAETKSTPISKRRIEPKQPTEGQMDKWTNGLETSRPVTSDQRPTTSRPFPILYCGICRTDAKMWDEGQRDLALPRILGHEFVVQDHEKTNYAVWPAENCGGCIYCQTGRENLCEDLIIRGFHKDGGFQSYIDLPPENLFPLAPSTPAHLGTLAEPIGCCLNAIEKIKLATNERVIIYGGGTQGLLLALAIIENGGQPTIIETNEEKIAKAENFCQSLNIEIVKETDAGDFDVAINACASTIAFAQCLTKLKKGGRLCFFSGLPSSKHLMNNVLNLTHYKEFEIYGSYGLTRKHIPAAVELITKHKDILELVIEAIIPPQAVNTQMQDVLAGNTHRIIIKMPEVGSQRSEIDRTTALQSGCKKQTSLPRKAVLQDGFQQPKDQIPEIGDQKSETSDQRQWTKDYLSSIARRATEEGLKTTNKTLLPQIQHAIDNKTKPVGSLGKLEDIAIKCALIQQTTTPILKTRTSLVFAADHGIAIEGVSAYPAEVTPQMCINFLNGGAAINAICNSTGASFHLVNMGVNYDFSDEPQIIDRSIRKGTSNFAVEPAMTEQEAHDALKGGMSAFEEIYNNEQSDIVAIGEMGIGNTSSATAITAAICNMPVSELTGRGTGVDDVGLLHKQKVITKALNYHKPSATDPIDILSKVGGFEIAGMAGAMLKAASTDTIIVIDGFISTSAALIAQLLCPHITDYMIAGHKSVEKGQIAALKKLNLTPILDLDMRLGEGTGATLTMNLAVTATDILRNMASFDEAGVSRD